MQIVRLPLFYVCTYDGSFRWNAHLKAQGTGEAGSWDRMFVSVRQLSISAASGMRVNGYNRDRWGGKGYELLNWTLFDFLGYVRVSELVII